MKKIAFVFLSPPHGSSAGREGLDALLATSALTEHVAAFFVGDGVLQLLPEQQPTVILARDYISTFKVLPLYDIERCYVCEESLNERGFDSVIPFILPVEVLQEEVLQQCLQSFDMVLTF